MRKLFTRMLKDESGASAIEYGLIVALVSMLAIGAYSNLGDSIQDFFNDLAGSLDGVARPASK